MNIYPTIDTPVLLQVPKFCEKVMASGEAQDVLEHIRGFHVPLTGDLYLAGYSNGKDGGFPAEAEVVVCPESGRAWVHELAYPSVAAWYAARSPLAALELFKGDKEQGKL